MAAKKNQKKAAEEAVTTETVTEETVTEDKGTPANDALADLSNKVTRIHDKVFPAQNTPPKQQAPAKKDAEAGTGWDVLMMGLVILALPIIALVAMVSIGRKNGQQPVTVRKF